jgi:hypothetical protein
MEGNMEEVPLPWNLVDNHVFETSELIPFDLLGIPIWILDVDEWVYVWGNATGKELTDRWRLTVNDLQLANYGR